MYPTNPTNPFSIAFAALTAPNARAYYKMRAQQDIGLTVWAIATAAIATYQLGAAVAEELRAAVEAAQPGALAVIAEVAEVVDDILEGEIVAEFVIAGQLPAAATLPRQSVADAIAFQLRDRSLCNLAYLAAASEEPVPVAKRRTRKATVCVAGPAPKSKGKKPAAKPAKRQSPTRVTVGGRKVCID